MSARLIRLPFGTDREAHFEVEPDALLYLHERPEPLPDVLAATTDALNSPTEFPPLEKAVLGDDRVAIALDARTPCGPDVVRGVVDRFLTVGVSPGRIAILTAHANGEQPDPREALDDSVRESVRWVSHDPDADDVCGYLASTAGGERIYLSHELLDADVAVSVGPLGYDALLGRSGTHSVFYPAFSDRAATRRFVGQTHSELDPDDVRPLRQLVDEVGWLLGNQLTVQVVPAGGGEAHAVEAGLADAMVKSSAAALDECWRVTLPVRPDLVILGLDGQCTWAEFGAALDAALAVVATDGRIVMLTELAEQPGEGVRQVMSAYEAKDALKPLREEHPDDVLAATAIARAADRATVHLLSMLSDEQVEDLFMLPLASPDDLGRLLELAEQVAVFPSAQYVHVGVGR